MTDEDLMLVYRQGSADAFEELFGRYRHAIWGYFRRRLTDRARAEELTQDTFVAVMEGAARYEPRARFRTYLYAIAFNVLSAERRKMRNRSSQSLDDVAVVAGRASDPDDSLWLSGAFAQLDVSDREILMLREYEQCSYGEIATLLGMPLNTVRTRLFRARLELRRLLKPEPETRGTLS
jgi:RNA polymerase sigma-70 factor (ECF subfamily)